MLITVWVILLPGGYLKEFTDEESNFTAILQRAMDLEGVDRETVYQLVSLLMKVPKKSICLNTFAVSFWAV